MEERYQKEKTWNTVGVILGVCILAAGIYFLLKPFSASFYTTTPESASFGGDFYTYVYEAVRDSARNAAAAVSVADDILDAVNFYAAMAFVVCGLLTTVCFARRLALCRISMERGEEQLRFRQTVLEMLNKQNEDQTKSNQLLEEFLRNQNPKEEENREQ